MKASVLLVMTIFGLAGEARADDGSFCVSGFVQGPEYGNGGAGSTQQDACAANPGKKKNWHFHGFVEKSGKCYACWDEESSTCETKAPQQGFRYLGAMTCGPVAVAAPTDGGQVFDPKVPAPRPLPPKPPAKPAKPAK